MLDVLSLQLMTQPVSTCVCVCVTAGMSDLSVICLLKYGLCFSCVRMHVQPELVQCAVWLRCVWVG